MVVEGGRAAGQTTPESARKDGLTVVDLSDDWLPFVFSETPEKPQPLRPFLQDLANGRMRAGKNYARPREDRFFEAFGIFPSLNLVRRRLADKQAPRLPRQGEGRGARGAGAQERDPAGGAGEDPEPQPRDGRRNAHDHDRADNLAATADPDGEAGRDRDAGPPALRGSAVRQGDLRPDGSPDGRGPEDLPAAAHARRQLEDRSRHPHRAAWATAASTTSGCCCACCASGSSTRPGCSRTARRWVSPARCRGACWTAPSSSRWPCRRTSRAGRRRAPAQDAAPTPRRRGTRRTAAPRRRPRSPRRRI